jgi:hypothetical protein
LSTPIGMYHWIAFLYGVFEQLQPELLEETSTSMNLQAIISLAVSVMQAFRAARWRWNAIVGLREHMDPPIVTFCVGSPMSEKNHGKIVVARTLT